MLAANISCIEDRVRAIIEKKGKAGWLRVNECSKFYAEEPITRAINETERTNFFRWHKKVEKGKIDGFQVLKLPGNISFIGLKSADPNAIESFISEDKRMSRSAKNFGFFEWLKWRDERKDKERRICKYRVAVGRERLYLLTQFDVGDGEFTRRLEKAKAKFQKQYGLEHDYD